MALVRVYVSPQEWYPVYAIDDEDFRDEESRRDLPSEIVTEWQEAARRFKAAQRALRDAWEAAK